jgi:hypothetical protein
MDVKPPHEAKALSGIVVILQPGANVKEVAEEHSSKQHMSSVSTDAGTKRDGSSLHAKKADSPISRTWQGSSKVSRERFPHCEKQPLGMMTTDEGMQTEVSIDFSKELEPKVLSEQGGWKRTVVREEHSLKQDSPSSSRDGGMDMVRREEQRSKAHLSIERSLDGDSKSTWARAPHCEKQLEPIISREAGRETDWSIVW